jgi:hypothetical protein
VNHAVYPKSTYMGHGCNIVNDTDLVSLSSGFKLEILILLLALFMGLFRTFRCPLLTIRYFIKIAITDLVEI